MPPGWPPHSDAWFVYGDDKLERMYNGEKVDLTGMTIEYVDMLMARADEEDALEPTSDDD